MPAPKEPSSSRTRSSLHGVRILLLEDDPTDAIMAKESISSLGAVVEHVTTLADLIDRLRAESPDVVVIDLHVPDSQGLITVRKTVAATSAPVVVLSGIGDHETGRAAIRAGAQDYLTKGTLDPDVLSKTLTYAAERSKLRAQIRNAQQRFDLALEASRDGLWEWEQAEDTLTVSARFRHALGLEGRVLMQSLEDWTNLIHEADRDRFEAAMQDHVTGASPILELKIRMQHTDGGWRKMHCRGLAARYNDRMRVAGSLTDINELSEKTLRLHHAAMHDSLTGLPNRAALHKRLMGAAHRAQIDQKQFAVLLLDLDRFKQVNDSMGHPVGDGLLQAASRRLSQAVRSRHPRDFVSRIGGDEFVLVVDNIDGNEGAKKIARRLHSVLKTPIRSRGHELFTSASIGIRISDGTEDADDLLRDADAAMYRAKRLGRAKHVIFDEDMRAETVRELETETMLRRAISEKRFELHLQPVVDIESRRIRSYEALVRLRKKNGDLLSPGLFMDVAEESGLIVPIGQWVFEEAARISKELAKQTEGQAPVIAINVSPRQLREPDFVERLIQVIENARLARGALAIEVTETTLIEDPQTAAERLAAVRSHGVRVCLDDFGVGYSSLSWLLDYPFDVLKIDRSFVTELPTCDRRRAIVKAVCDLAKVCQVQVVCEGIETEEQAAVFQKIGGTLGQGYLFARPAPPDWILETGAGAAHLKLVSG